MPIVKSKLSVLILHSAALSPFPSGELHVALAECKYLAAQGISVQFCEFKPDKLPQGVVGNRMYGAFANIWSASAYEFVKSCVSASRPDIVHFHGLFPYLSASALKAAHDAGAAVVQTLHNGRWVCLEGGFYRDGQFCDNCVGRGGWPGVRHGCKHGVAVSTLCQAANLSALLRGRLFGWVDRFIAVSDFIRDQHVLAGFPPDKIVVKNNGVDTARLRSALPAAKRAGIAYVGRVSTAKGVAILRALAERLSERIHVVGDGPDLPLLRRYCEQHGLTHVQFWGKQPQASCFEVMAGACCTVIPSQCGEAFPLVAVESMGLGTPVVGSDIGGLGPLLRASDGGVAVSPVDDEAFLFAVRRLLDHPSEAIRLGNLGRQYVLENLSFEKNAAELVSIYQAVIEKKKSHADRI